jgi:hypothetical protein
VTIPINATLVSGAEYRVGFFAATTNPAHQGKATLFTPGSFPYTETTGVLTINGAYQSPTDSYPANTNIFEPQVILQVAILPPKLRITRTTSTTATLSWPASAKGWTLQQSPSLTSPASWTRVPPPYAVVNGQNQVVVGLLAPPAQMFFRLIYL